MKRNKKQLPLIYWSSKDFDALSKTLILFQQSLGFMYMYGYLKMCSYKLGYKNLFWFISTDFYV